MGTTAAQQCFSHFHRVLVSVNVFTCSKELGWGVFRFDIFLIFLIFLSTSTGMVWQLYLHKVNPSAKIIKPRQNDCNILGATCCARLATLLRYVATCCHMLGAVGSNLKLVKFFMQHREPSHPFGIWIKDQISRYFEFLIHARGLLVRCLEPRLRKTLVACSEI